jgi:hypothetical protein
MTRGTGRLPGSAGHAGLFRDVGAAEPPHGVRRGARWLGAARDCREDVVDVHMPCIRVTVGRCFSELAILPGLVDLLVRW